MFYECPFHFKCKNTYCVPLKHVCDHEFDCPNGEDETRNLCLNHTCSGMFKCVYANLSHCLHHAKICDGFKDCNDLTYAGEDESVCLTGVCPEGCYCFGHAYACVNIMSSNFPSPSYFKCPDSYCIPVRHRCDSVLDCPFGEDEKTCSQFTCKGHFWCPLDKKCLSFIDICDGTMHCLLTGEDEFQCDIRTCPALCFCAGDSIHCINKGFLTRKIIPNQLQIMLLTFVL